MSLYLSSDARFLFSNTISSLMSYGVTKFPDNSNVGGYANKKFVQSMLAEIPHAALGIFKNMEEITLRR